MIPPRSAFPLLCGLLACLSWSVGSVVSKVALSSMEPLALLTGQLGVSVLSLSALSFCLGAPLRWSDWRVGLPGVLQPGLSHGLSILGLAMLPVTVEGMLFALETPLVVLFAWPILGEVPNRAIGALCLLGLAGVGLLSWNAETDLHALRLLAVVLVLAGVVFAALYNIAIRQMSRNVDALRLTGASQIVAFLTVGLVWIVVSRPAASSLTIADAILVIASGLFLQAIPFLLYGIALERMSATAAALLLPLIPVLTAILASVFLQEMLSVRQWAGAATILVAGAGMPLALRSLR